MQMEPVVDLEVEEVELLDRLYQQYEDLEYNRSMLERDLVHGGALMDEEDVKSYQEAIDTYTTELGILAVEIAICENGMEIPDA